VDPEIEAIWPLAIGMIGYRDSSSVLFLDFPVEAGIHYLLATVNERDEIYRTYVNSMFSFAYDVTLRKYNATVSFCRAVLPSCERG